MPDMGNGFAESSVNRGSSLDIKDDIDEVTKPYDVSSGENRYGSVNYGSDTQEKEDKDKYVFAN